MSMNSLLADTLARLRNAQLARKAFTIVQSSKLIKNVLNVLQKEGYIAAFQEVEERKGVNVIKVDLKYHEGEPVIKELKMISKPGRKVCTPIADLQKAMGGLGIYVLSTSHGVLSDFEARNQNVGGKVLFKIS